MAEKGAAKNRRSISDIQDKPKVKMAFLMFCDDMRAFKSEPKPAVQLEVRIEKQAILTIGDTKISQVEQVDSDILKKEDLRMKKLLAITLALAMALSFAACGEAENKPVSTAIPLNSTGIDSVGGSSSLSQWVDVYEGGDVTIEMEEQVAGTLTAKVYEQMLLDCDLVLEGGIATGSVLIQPEMQGGDMNLETAREQFPNCLYEFTLSLDGMSMTYHRVLRLTYMGEEDRPEQIEELSANLRKTTQNNK